MLKKENLPHSKSPSIWEVPLNTNKTIHGKNFFLLLLGWTLLSLIYSLFDILDLEKFNNFILIPASLLYLYAFVKPRGGEQDIKIIILLYAFLKFIFLVFSMLDDDFFTKIIYTDDALCYHIPRILSINGDNFTAYLFDYKNYASETGKFTHIVYAFFYTITKPILELYCYDSIRNVATVVYIVNAIMLITACLYLYKTLQEARIDNQYILYSIALILFSPFILTWSAFTTKETIHVVLMIFLVIAVIKNNTLILFLISIYFLIDRMYILYVLFSVFLFSKSIDYRLKILFLLLSAGMLSQLPLDKFFSQYMYITDSYNDGALKGDSLVNSNSYIFNILRVFFSPFFISAFKEKFVDYNFFFREHIVISLLYSYFLIKTLLSKNRFSKLLWLIILFNFLLFPTNSRQKITILIPLLSIIYPIYLHSIKHNIKMDTYWKF